MLHIARLYYTASLALGFGSLMWFVKTKQSQSRGDAVVASLLLFGASLINLRFGAMFVGILFVYLWLSVPKMNRLRWIAATLSTSALILAVLVYAVMSLKNPAAAQTNYSFVRQSMWPTGFVFAAGMHLFPLLYVVVSRMQDFNRWERALVVASGSYFGSLALCFAGHWTYYGDFLLGSDHTVLNRFSDLALIGGLLGFVLGWRIPFRFETDPFVSGDEGQKRNRSDAPSNSVEWFLIWALAFMVLGMSAFGQGWGQRFAPQRFLVLLGVPLSVVSAFALIRLRSSFPRSVRSYVVAMVMLGVTSVLVGSVVLLTPVGRSVSLLWSYRVDTITVADSKLIENIQSGVVLSAGRDADLVAMRTSARVIGGIGAMDLSDRPFDELERASSRFLFFGEDDVRRALIREWCIDTVYCPSGWTVSGFVASLRASPLFEEVATEGEGAIFRVNRAALDE